MKGKIISHCAKYRNFNHLKSTTSHSKVTLPKSSAHIENAEISSSCNMKYQSWTATTIIIHTLRQIVIEKLHQRDRTKRRGARGAFHRTTNKTF